VVLDDELLFSKKKAGRFPETGEVTQLLATRIPRAG